MFRDSVTLVDSDAPIVAQAYRTGSEANNARRPVPKVAQISIVNSISYILRIPILVK